ncbi:hypothetical protein LTR08_001288 [Meristemomyces frigidus]|nr:hypothetical protein LTR08_001288 [Meristemomyces frigidus]
MLGNDTNHGLRRRLLHMAGQIAKLQREPQAQKTGAGTLQVYREAFVLAKHWLPAIVTLLQNHGSIARSVGQQVRAALANDGERGSGDGNNLISMISRFVKAGLQALNHDEEYWDLRLLREVHGALGTFIEKAEGEIKGLERVVDGRDGHGRQFMLGDGSAGSGYGFLTGPSSAMPSSAPRGQRGCEQ